jgi:hypothetical protein
MTQIWVSGKIAIWETKLGTRNSKILIEKQGKQNNIRKTKREKRKMISATTMLLSLFALVNFILLEYHLQMGYVATILTAFYLTYKGFQALPTILLAANLFGYASEYSELAAISAFFLFVHLCCSETPKKIHKIVEMTEDIKIIENNPESDEDEEVNEAIVSEAHFESTREVLMPDDQDFTPPADSPPVKDISQTRRKSSKSGRYREVIEAARLEAQQAEEERRNSLIHAKYSSPAKKVKKEL